MEDKKEEESKRDKLKDVLDSIFCNVLYIIFYPILKLFRRD